MNFLVINFPWYQYTPFFWLLGAIFSISPYFWATKYIKSLCHSRAVRSEHGICIAAPVTV